MTLDRAVHPRSERAFNRPGAPVMHPVTAAPVPGRWGPSPRSFAVFLLCAYVFLLPVQVSVPGGRVAPSDAFLLLYLLIWFPRITRVPSGWSRWHPALVAVFAMGSLVAYARTGGVSLYALGPKTAGLLFLLVGYTVLLDHCTSVARTRLLLQWFVAGVVLNAAVALAFYAVQRAGLLSTSRINYDDARLSGLLIDPNAFGGIAVVALVLHLWTVASPAPVWPWKWPRAVGLLLLVALALTFSRSAWIAFVASALAALLIHGRAALRPLSKLYVASLGIGVGLALAYLPDLTSLALRPDQVTGRVSILRDAFGDFAHSPVFGIGLGASVEEHGVIIHNTTAWFATELGVIGLIVFLGFVGWYLRGLLALALHQVDPIRSLALAILLAQVAMLGLSVGIEAFYQRYWWVLFAAAGGLFATRVKSRDEADV
ncbi:MAG: hypothetical protein QOF58_4722 [Pseudonocardiales bacterium]|nr:hypothetical protein [Pseudonocardiales bacterium]